MSVHELKDPSSQLYVFLLLQSYGLSESLTRIVVLLHKYDDKGFEDVGKEVIKTKDHKIQGHTI